MEVEKGAEVQLQWIDACPRSRSRSSFETIHFGGKSLKRACQLSYLVSYCRRPCSSRAKSVLFNPILAMGIVVDIVTGASQGIGRAIAESIAVHESKHYTLNPRVLVLVGRNIKRGTEAAKQAQKLAGNNGRKVWFEACNLGDYEQVCQLKDRIQEKAGDSFTVGILVNDAAECPQRQQFVQIPQRQPDGQVNMKDVDAQFATNVLGYHFMLKVFSDHFTIDNEHPTHVVNVASNWAGDLDLTDLSFTRRHYDNDSAYRQSKQCDRMLSKLWSDKLPHARINSCHPGDPCTTLSKDLGYNLWASPPTRDYIERSTPIPMLCGFGPRPVASGGWYEGVGGMPGKCRFANLGSKSQTLFDICESYCVMPDQMK